MACMQAEVGLDLAEDSSLDAPWAEEETGAMRVGVGWSETVTTSEAQYTSIDLANFTSYYMLRALSA